MSNAKTIYEFPKNRRENIRIQLMEYEGRTLLSIRVFYFDGELDIWKPGQQGVAIRVELLPKLKEGIDKAYELWKRLDSNPGSNNKGEGKLADEGDETL